ncbi:Na(+)-translocating NADH-quinone reductase subunit A [Barnesiella sp. WM24]|uniref:Na(+)-translocating NADH-quinone reductase subunit A n=1 Tax=Barnesiella sp. WM24 TaxID=2558278 RepID=UPI0010723688|nr:Na(+)-translocating NADH-quinone reductase subunit A [Barnesiella sp. WM24]TFU94691.1 Na(+)-translocating NADH-quinone reductase subunit A [Barnesiella sp. WM24]
MTKIVNIKKGLDISIRGNAVESAPIDVTPATCAIIPDDFPGITPKVDVKEGDEVVVGSTLFHDKAYPDVKVTSPVAGKVTAIVRGERRKLERIVITPGTSPSTSLDFEVNNIDDRTRASRLLLDSGLWAWMRQRPYDIVPNPGVTPRDIFITGFDSAPLAPDFEMMLDGKQKELSAAVALLKKFTDGDIYIGIHEGSCLEAIDGVETIIMNGPHPAGNVGVQICNVKPVNKGETVWTMDALTLLRIGKLATSGSLDMTVTAALTGCEVTEPHYINTIAGADMKSVLKGAVNNDDIHHRVISGNVLTGIPVGEEGYLRFPYRQVTVIAEGDDFAEFMGWASLSPQKMSVNRSFPGHFFRHKFCPDARILGGRRAMIMSGVYEKVMPMDILPEYLIKAIIARDIDRMEQLGIYEVAPEDFALCEYVDPSKLELQKIVQEGLDYLRKELS